MRVRAIWRWLVMVALASLPALLFADGASDVRLDWQAPECGDESAFVAQLHARNPRIRIGVGPRTLLVRIRQTNAGVSGTLTLREADGSEHARAVEGSSCAEIIPGLALIAAIAIDPLAASASSSAPSSSVPTEAPPTLARWRGSIALDAEMASGVTPLVLLAAPLSFEIVHETTSWFSPAARLRFAISGAGARTAPGIGADFLWVTGALDLCPIALEIGHFRAQPCGRLEIGARNASPVGVAPSMTALRPAASLGPVLDLRWSFGPIFFADLEGGAVFSLVSDHYFFEPDLEVFRVPIVGARVGAGMGATIW